MDYIAIGEVLKPKGIKGGIKVRPLTDDMRRYDKLKLVYIDSLPHKILSVSYEGSFVVLFLQGIDDRNAAELLRGKIVNIDRHNAIDPDDGAYFIEDIIGCSLMGDDGVKIGEILTVDSFGSADVISGKTMAGKDFRFPFLNRIVKNVDVDSKEFTVLRKLWQEVVVFDD